MTTEGIVIYMALSLFMDLILKVIQVLISVKLYRNMVNPELGLYIFNEAFNKPTKQFEQQTLL